MPLLARSHRWKSRSFLGFVCVLALLYVGLTGLRYFFPLEYRDAILEWSDTYDLDPAWVASIIRFESRFQPNAMSRAGAVGLMQIMPETGAWIAKQLDLGTYSQDQLTDPAINIQLGTWYLRYLLHRFSAPDSALMAYNAGPTHADRWGGELELAFTTTQQYIRRIHLFLPIYRFYFRALWLVDLIPPTRLFY